MALTASSVIEDVAKYLSDFDEDESYVHWSEDELLSYFKKAVGIIVATQKDKFTKQTEIRLTKGIYQQIPDSCESDVSVLGLSDEDGIVTSPVRRASLYNTPRLGRPLCRAKVSSSGYKMVSYDFSPSGREIIVDPPVPDGADATLTITCFQPPSITGIDSVVDLSGTHEAAVFELMLYYAWGVDIEDNANRERSDSHWNKAMQLMQLSTGLQELARQVR